MSEDWRRHEIWLRENRANGIGSDPREDRQKDYGEVHEPAPGIDRVTRAREDAESDDAQDKRDEYQSPEHLSFRDRLEFDAMEDDAA